MFDDKEASHSKSTIESAKHSTTSGVSKDNDDRRCMDAYHVIYSRLNKLTKKYHQVGGLTDTRKLRWLVIRVVACSNGHQ